MKGKKRILVVDDSRFLLELFSTYLQEAGYAVIEAHDGVEACELLESQGPFDLVLTDFSMPGKDGLAVLQRARELDPSAKVIVMSANAPDNLKDRGFKLGALSVRDKTTLHDIECVRVVEEALK